MFVEYLCNRSPKIKTKNIKNYSSILAIVNHWNWLDDSPPLNSYPLNLLLVRSHQAEIIIVKRLIQGRNNVTRVRVEPRFNENIDDLSRKNIGRFNLCS